MAAGPTSARTPASGSFLGRGCGSNGSRRRQLPEEGEGGGRGRGRAPWRTATRARSASRRPSVGRSVTLSLSLPESTRFSKWRVLGRGEGSGKAAANQRPQPGRRGEAAAGAGRVRAQGGVVVAGCVDVRDVRSAGRVRPCRVTSGGRPRRVGGAAASAEEGKGRGGAAPPRLAPFPPVGCAPRVLPQSAVSRLVLRAAFPSGCGGRGSARRAAVALTGRGRPRRSGRRNRSRG